MGAAKGTQTNTTALCRPPPPPPLHRVPVQVAELVVQDQYAAATPLNMFPGLKEGAVGLADPSFYVTKRALEEVAGLRAAFLNGSTNVFCGVIATNKGTAPSARGPGHGLVVPGVVLVRALLGCGGLGAGWGGRTKEKGRTNGADRACGFGTCSSVVEEPSVWRTADAEHHNSSAADLFCKAYGTPPPPPPPTPTGLCSSSASLSATSNVPTPLLSVVNPTDRRGCVANPPICGGLLIFFPALKRLGTSASTTSLRQHIHATYSELWADRRGNGGRRPTRASECS